MSDAVSNALAALEHASAPAGFACRLTLPAEALELAVEGVGEIPLPVSARCARTLAGAGRPAPFGLGERTIHDTNVRDVLEIPKRRVRIGTRTWKRHLEPEHEEFEGYMGNYGDTLERRYHRAAVVLWPTDRHHRVLLDMGAGTFVREVLRESDDAARVPAVREAVRSILDRWMPRHRTDDADTFADTLALCARLGDADLALALLSGFRLGAVVPKTMKALLGLGHRFGDDFRRALVDEWTREASPWRPARSPSDMSVAERMPEPTRQRLPWIEHLPTLCKRAHALDGNPWRDALETLLERLHAQLRRQHAESHRGSSPSVREAAVDAEATALAHLLDAADELGSPGAAAAILDALRADLDAYLPDVPVRVVEHVAKARISGTDGAPKDAVKALRGATAARLGKALAVPAREPDDWRIAADLDCSCPDCTALGAFLGDRREQALDLSIAKDRRAHLHSKIDMRELPVSHVTRRVGRPYTLELRKQRSLFERARQQRAREQALFRRLGAPDDRPGRA